MTWKKIEYNLFRIFAQEMHQKTDAFADLWLLLYDPRRQHKALDAIMRAALAKNAKELKLWVVLSGHIGEAISKRNKLAHYYAVGDETTFDNVVLVPSPFDPKKTKQDKTDRSLFIPDETINVKTLYRFLGWFRGLNAELNQYILNRVDKTKKEQKASQRI